MSGLVILLLAFSLTGCGKTLDQVKTVGHALIEVGGKVYEDLKDNVETAKKLAAPQPGQ